jgi:magnesium transporter
MIAEDLKGQLVERLQSGDFSGLKQVLGTLTPADFAEAIEELPAEEQAVLFRLLPTGSAADVFEYLPVESQEELIHAMSSRDAARILEAMSSDDRTALFEELPTAVCARLIELLSPEERRIALRLLDYPEDSIGRLMTSEYLTIRDEWTVEQVLEQIRSKGNDFETLNVLYVIDDAGILLDDIRIREFLFAPRDRKVKDLRDGKVTLLHAADHQEEAVKAFQKYDRTVLPVVDGNGGLVGIVTVDDVLDVAEEEATEDIQKLGGMEQLDEPYMDISIGRLVKKRASWLVVLFLGEMLTATAMGHYEEQIEKAVVLALFVPLIISSGGNSGSQAATLIIRAMALGEVRLKDWWRVMRREILSGLSLGLILAIIGVVRIVVWAGIFPNVYGPHWALIGITVGISLMGVVLWGTLSGSMLPFLLKRCGLDPATSSAPFVATLVDVTGLVIYFAVAGTVLHSALNAPPPALPSPLVYREATAVPINGLEFAAVVGSEWRAPSDSAEKVPLLVQLRLSNTTNSDILFPASRALTVSIRNAQGEETMLTPESARVWQNIVIPADSSFTLSSAAYLQWDRDTSLPVFHYRASDGHTEMSRPLITGEYRLTFKISAAQSDATSAEQTPWFGEGETLPVQLQLVDPPSK